MMAKEDTIAACANCGKGEESSDDLKACTACKLVKYCNRECQIAHRPLHKKACKKRAAEIHDEALFKEPPPHEECPICFLPLPLDAAPEQLSNRVVVRLSALAVFLRWLKKLVGEGKSAFVHSVELLIPLLKKMKSNE